MKKLIFISQSKGGCGKSVLTFLLAEKYPEAIILDMDDATKTTKQQLAYRDPQIVAFLNSNNVIDRGTFNTFLEMLSTSNNELFICDLGASIAEQFPFYLNDVNEFLPAILEELGIELEIFSVVGGANIFNQTMSYLADLINSVNKNFKVKIFKNDYFDFSSTQNDTLDKFAILNEIDVVPFNITKDKNEVTQARVLEVLKSGNGIKNASPFSKMYFNQALKNINI